MRTDLPRPPLLIGFISTFDGQCLGEKTVIFPFSLLNCWYLLGEPLVKYQQIETIKPLNLYFGLSGHRQEL